MFRTKLGIVLTGFFLISNANSSELIQCKLSFDSYTSPSIGRCVVKIDRQGKIKFKSSCSKIKSQISPMMKGLKQYLFSKKEIKISISIGDISRGSIDGIGQRSKAKTKPLIEMSNTLELIDFNQTEVDGFFSGRYPAGTAGQPLRDIPLPFNTIKIDTNNGRAELNNELGSFVLTGSCK
jgi:hypothetical protein